jgi:diamine N-acetyltransferase
MNNNISLRHLEEKDAPLMLEWIQDPEVNKHFRFNSDNMTMDSVMDFIDNSQDMRENVNFAIVDMTDEYLGTVSLKSIDLKVKNAEYAIVLRKKAQGKGYGLAATVKILEYAFNTLNLERVYLNVLSNNEKAIRLYKNLGFIYEGEFKEHISIRGEIHSTKWYRLTNAEFKSSMKKKTIYDVHMLDFPNFVDERGNLVVIEGVENIPFDIKRVFYAFDSASGVVRGKHANRHSSFCIINISGSCKVRVVDQAGSEKIYILDRPNMGLYVPSMIWKDMYDFSPESILLVLSNEKYDATEYIHDFDVFLRG